MNRHHFILILDITKQILTMHSVVEIVLKLFMFEYFAKDFFLCKYIHEV